MKTYVHKKPCTIMFIATLFIIATNWKYLLHQKDSVLKKSCDKFIHINLMIFKMQTHCILCAIFSDTRSILLIYSFKSSFILGKFSYMLIHLFISLIFIFYHGNSEMCILIAYFCLSFTSILFLPILILINIWNGSVISKRSMP